VSAGVNRPPAGTSPRLMSMHPSDGGASAGGYEGAGLKICMTNLPTGDCRHGVITGVYRTGLRKYCNSYTPDQKCGLCATDLVETSLSYCPAHQDGRQCGNDSASAAPDRGGLDTAADLHLEVRSAGRRRPIEHPRPRSCPSLARSPGRPIDCPAAGGQCVTRVTLSSRIPVLPDCFLAMSRSRRPPT
jgi:hypothetical protein